MKSETPFKIRSLVQLFEILPEEERIIVDVLRQIILENLPDYCKEKISYNVPFFYGNKSICIVWPSTIPKGGIKEGVLLGFYYGNKLQDIDNYLLKGTNKQVFYKIYRKAEDIDEDAIKKLLEQAIIYDKSQKKKSKRLIQKTTIEPETYTSLADQSFRPN